MSGLRPNARAELATFFAITFGLSFCWYFLIVAASGMERGAPYVVALMWTPAVGALTTRLIFQRHLRDLGWRWPELRWAALAYLLPLVYASAAYAAVWLTGLGGVDLSKKPADGLEFVLLGTATALVWATGEEIGWRGYLVPALLRTMSFARTAFSIGIVWALWHVPLILFAGYDAGTPALYATSCFIAMVLAVSVILTWLRVRSGSVWPAALLHASHNLYLQGLFDPITVDTGATRWWTSEFGAAVALAIALAALPFWRGRHRLAEINGIERPEQRA